MSAVFHACLQSWPLKITVASQAPFVVLHLIKNVLFSVVWQQVNSQVVLWWLAVVFQRFLSQSATPKTYLTKGNQLVEATFNLSSHGFPADFQQRYVFGDLEGSQLCLKWYPVWAQLWLGREIKAQRDLFPFKSIGSGRCLVH